MKRDDNFVIVQQMRNARAAGARSFFHFSIAEHQFVVVQRAGASGIELALRERTT